ncbi:hypothetical protein TSA1_26745 [Bradyrhizobium nitroreducens]|uniref:Uncharacterized protein n=1 Tax=Bradyrhizobium nitroreducens TaxID=709803 RepID=A0A2M6UHE4_9BRAD|nr:hypothetical protein [Bradyrhizobium nitroreducens]PIT03968.1 hypothetical protein TSA1_26745 [Bradyrhizobium nitroreducens]
MADDLISLSEALNELENFIAAKEPSWTDHWQTELAKDLASLLKPTDQANEDGLPDKYPPPVRAWHNGDSAAVWHNYKKAALFLRLHMEQGHLPLHVRDPAEDRLLPLLPEDWLPWTPKDRLADDFLQTGNYGVRGRDGSRFYAQLEYALIYRKEFDQWLINHLLYPSTRAGEREAIKRAVYAMWNGYPPFQGKARDRKIHEWLAKNEEDYLPEKYSKATINRALAEIHEEQLDLLRYKSPR